MVTRSTGKTRMVRIPEKLADLVHLNALAAGMSAPAYLGARFAALLNEDAKANAKFIRKVRRARKAQQP